MNEFEVLARNLIVKYNISDIDTERVFPVLLKNSQKTIIEVAKLFDDYNCNLDRERILQWGVELTDGYVTNYSKTYDAESIKIFLLLDIDAQLYPGPVLTHKNGGKK